MRHTHIDPLLIRTALLIPAQRVLNAARDWHIAISVDPGKAEALFPSLASAVAEATQPYDWRGLADTIEWQMFANQYTRVSATALKVAEILRRISEDPPLEAGWIPDDFEWLPQLENSLISLQDALGNDTLSAYYAAILNGEEAQLTPKVIEALAAQDREIPPQEDEEEIEKQFYYMSINQNPALVALPEPAATLNRFFWELSRLAAGTEFDAGNGSVLLSSRAKAYLIDLFQDHIKQNALHKISLEPSRPNNHEELIIPRSQNGELAKQHEGVWVDESGRLAIEKSTKTIMFDGVKFEIKRPGAFKFFDVVAKAGGDLLKAAEINKQPGCKGRLDRLKKLLPAELQDLLIGTRGPGGGYSLKLPPLQR